LKTSVLLVEDSKIQRLRNEQILHKAGYTVLSAGDGQEALRVAHEATPDLILLDLLLPKLSGQEVLLTLKQDPATAQIPVIVISSLPQINEPKLRKAGAAAYIEKSRVLAGEAGEKELLEIVERVIQESRAKIG
jgi:CheY-like chemotaxis protein